MRIKYTVAQYNVMLHSNHTFFFFCRQQYNTKWYIKVFHSNIQNSVTCQILHIVSHFTDLHIFLFVSPSIFILPPCVPSQWLESVPPHSHFPPPLPSPYSLGTLTAPLTDRLSTRQSQITQGLLVKKKITRKDSAFHRVL